MAENLSSKEKAAVLMVALGKEYSSKLYQHLTDEEIEQLTLGITGLRTFDKETRDEVLAEFFEICVAQKYISEGGIEYAREILIGAVGEDRADEMIGRLSSALQIRPFDFARRSDPAQVGNFIKNEHPQTIALILSYLEPDKAAYILSSLPEDIQSKVVQRVATMSTVSMEYIREAERILERKLSNIGVEENSNIGGVDTIVDMLNAIDRSTEKRIMDNIETEDPELAEEIHRRMFVFEDVVKLTDQAIQRVLKEVDNDVLTLAIKGVGEDSDITVKIYQNISSRLRETIEENMEYLGPVRVRDVEEAQQKVVTIIRKLEDEGEIEIARGGEDDALIV